MAELQKRKLSEAWKELSDNFTGMVVTTPDSLGKLAFLLLEVITLIADEKVRLVIKLKKQPQFDVEEYARRIHKLVAKGMAYEERKMMMELAVGKEVWDTTKRLEILIEMENACRRYESILRIIHDTMKLDLKLGFEGHS